MTKILSDAEVKELAAKLLPSDGLGGLAHEAALALLSLLKQQDASSNYFSARMMKANEEIQRLNEGWSEANSIILDLRIKAVGDSDADRRRILELEEQVKQLKAQGSPIRLDPVTMQWVPK